MKTRNLETTHNTHQNRKDQKLKAEGFSICRIGERCIELTSGELGSKQHGNPLHYMFNFDSCFLGTPAQIEIGGLTKDHCGSMSDLCLIKLVLVSPTKLRCLPCRKV